MKSLILADEAGKALTVKEKWLYVLIVLFLVTIYLPTMPVINNIFIGLIFVYSFFYNSVGEKIKLLKQRKAMLLMILFYILHLISAIISYNKDEATRMLGLRVPLIMFPIAIGLICIKKELKERILLCYCFTVTVAAIVCLMSALHVYRVTGFSAYLYDDSLTEAIGKQSIYFAQMVNVSIFGYIYLLVTRSKVVLLPVTVYLSIFFLLIMNFLLASRISILILYLSMFTFAFYYIIKQRKVLEGVTLIMGLFIGGFLLIKFFPKTINRFRELMYTQYQYNNHGVESHYDMQVTADQWNGANIRLAVWSCGWELYKEYPVFGAQIGDKKDKLLAIYKAKQFDFAYNSQRNMHNNYLDTLCTFGIVGLVFMLSGCLLFPLIACVKANDMLGLSIVIAFAFVMFSENYMDRSLGAVLLGFFLSFIAAYKKRKV
ncbi:MAG: O-antigen ligase family protein [Bacteroidetes bacterium]|nr:O-antigen ligase family protein [Bacteroidota bacterium]